MKLNTERIPLSEGQNKVLEFLKEYPGATKKEISNFLGSEFDSGQVSNLLTVLKHRKNAIENRGGHASKGRWYLKERPSVKNVPYLDEAQRIMEELFAMPPAFREEYLARCLQRIANEAH